MGDADQIRAVERRAVEVSWRTTWDFFVLTTRGGRVGVGELSDAGPDEVVQPIAADVAAGVAGLAVAAALAHVEARAEELVARLDPGPLRRAWLTVLGGLDAALCDVAAQEAGRPLASWLGAPPRPTPLYANINRAVGARTPAEFQRVARLAVDAGFRAVKCAPFDFLVGARRLRKGLDLARAVRSAIGDGVDLILDAHHRLALHELLTIAEDLRALDLRWLEDGVAIGDVPGLRQLRSAVGAPLAGGEFAATIEEVRPAIDAGVLDILMPDVKHAGGPRRALALARYAAGQGAEVTLHNPTGPVATAVSGAVSAAVPAAGILEYAVAEVPWRAHVLHPPEPVRGGTLAALTAVGIGAALDLARPSRLDDMPVGMADGAR
jgi:galactonate dehydratase